MPSPLTTLTLFGLAPGNVRWGLAQMGTSPPQLQRVPGLRFFKLFGSGKGQGFGLTPNFHRYGMMAVWESEEAAAAFFGGHALYQKYERRCQEIWTAYLAPLRSHGLWDGVNPFEYQAEAMAKDSADGPVAVLTRASIRLLKAPRFWKFVPQTSTALAEASGLLASIGLGELPLVRQATFSLWESAEAMQQYAYRGPLHREVIQRTRAEQWYKEELFARFRVLKTEGTWNGQRVL
ncbi:spheroidene monooxygenase [Hymenobacter sp. BT491]|uniref:spheroidene monooxygenase n=1 Tax=Hymenobacter sp. BT491 TaxID=2766779 RepID=UPI001653A20E|nr:spheroidene monooxygenase [Hymenobacter sp. BT491]MBC6989825.1 spheroidene monooxygenase [Hymenobacter sp. BT491]